MAIWYPSGRPSGATSISGAYTKAEADARFIPINGDTGVSGNKTFSNDVTIYGNLVLSGQTSGEFAWFDNAGNLIVSGYGPEDFATVSQILSVSAGLQSQIIALSANLTNEIVDIQSQINNNSSSIVSISASSFTNDAFLQEQINQIAQSTHVVFSEMLTGNGVSTQFVLNGNITNAEFISGSQWNALNIISSLQSDITDLNGKPIYDSGFLSLFTRHRINVETISGAGTVILDYVPQNNQKFYIWYWYDLKTGDRLDNYYRSDYIAKMEENGGDIATKIAVNTVPFNGILGSADVTVQQALQTIDQTVFNDYASNASVSAISSNLQIQINNISVSAVGGTVTEAYVANLTGSLQTQIISLSSSTNGALLSINGLVSHDTQNINIVGSGGITVHSSGTTVTISAAKPSIFAFTDLTDVPNSYDGTAYGYVASVNNQLDGLEFRKTSHLHDQSVPNNTWTIIHNLNKSGPLSINIIDTANTEIVGDVTYDSPNQLTVYFTSSTAGIAYII